jgi:hypothetical protein
MRGSFADREKAISWHGFQPVAMSTLILCGDALIDLDIGTALYEHRSSGAMAKHSCAGRTARSGPKLRYRVDGPRQAHPIVSETVVSLNYCVARLGTTFHVGNDR